MTREEYRKGYPKEKREEQESKNNREQKCDRTNICRTIFLLRKRKQELKYIVSTQQQNGIFYLLWKLPGV